MPRNIKTSLMFTMTICFLMYSSTSFSQREYMIFSLTGAIIGADIALFRSNDLTGQAISLEEKKLNEFFEANRYIPGGSGIVTSYGYKGQTVNEILINS
jgi:hypothetical protein